MSRSEEEMLFTIKGTFDCIDVNIPGYDYGVEDNMTARNIQEITYAVCLGKEEGEWKIKNIASGDLTSGYMFEDLDILDDDEVIAMARKPYTRVNMELIIEEIRGEGNNSPKGEKTTLDGWIGIQ